MDSIRNWLNGDRNYNVGASLYEVYGDDTKLKSMFAQGHSSIRQRRLEVELTQLFDHAEVVIIELPEQEQPLKMPVKASNLPENRLSPSEDPYYNDWHPLYLKMNAIRHRLRYIPDVIERGAAAFEILDLQEQCKYYWDKRDYYQRTGQHKPEAEALQNVVTNRNELEAARRTMLTYVTKYQKAVNLYPLNKSAVDKLARYIAERDRIEKILGYERTNGKCKRIA